MRVARCSTLCSVSSAVASTTIVFLRFEDLMRPVLKVREKTDQVVMALRSEPDEHLTVHRQASGALLLTHWSVNKPAGTWDALRAEGARKLGLRDAGRHASYLTHRPLVPVRGMDGHELCGRRVRLDAATPKGRYARMPNVVVDVPGPEVVLTFHLATPEQPYSAPEEPHVETALGGLYLRAGPFPDPRRGPASV